MAASKQTDAVALLKADHRKVEELFEKFESAKGSSAKQKLVQQICTELTVHTMIEEEIFYPACAGQIEDTDLVQEAYVEHDGAKVLIAELTASEPDDEFYDAKVTVLSEMIKHHVKEEEKRAEGLFAEAKDAGLDLTVWASVCRRAKRNCSRRSSRMACRHPKPARSAAMTCSKDRRSNRQPELPAMWDAVPPATMAAGGADWVDHES